jgi:hypothetical protein
MHALSIFTESAHALLIHRAFADCPFKAAEAALMEFVSGANKCVGGVSALVAAFLHAAVVTAHGCAHYQNSRRPEVAGTPQLVPSFMGGDNWGPMA